mgnify:CR=1 FL=1
MASKRIGFVDDELENYHANTYLHVVRGPLAERGYEVAGATALAAEAGAKWCAEKDVPYFDTVDELAAAVDCFVILAPGTPDTHLGLCEQVFPHGKITFVDKTFAPDVETAERIFALADEHGVPVQSTSALRTTNAQREVQGRADPLVNLAQWAGGMSFDEYGIHPVELAVSCLGPNAERVFVTGAADHPTVVIDFAGGRVATIDFNAHEHVPFEAMLTTTRASKPVTVVFEPVFVDAMRAILDFFDAGQPLVPREETLAVMKILAAASDPSARKAPLSL